MSLRSALRKFKPGQSAHIRRPWRAFVIIGLIGALGVIIMVMVRGSG